MTRDAYTRVVGYFAFTSPIDIVCDGDACVVAHSEAAMRRVWDRETRLLRGSQADPDMHWILPTRLTGVRPAAGGPRSVISGPTT